MKGTTFTSDEKITIWIKNFGTVSASDIPVYYLINDTVPVEEILDTAIIPGDSVTFSFDHTADMSDYKIYDIVVYTSLNGDTLLHNDTIYLTVEHEDTGVDDLYKKSLSDIRIYPNPTDGTFILSFEAIQNEKITISLQNLAGQTLYREKCQVWKGYQLIRINMENFRPGIYLLNIRTSYSSYTGKIIRN